jgi:hypothetical protein
MKHANGRQPSYLLGAGILGVFLTQVLTMWRERQDRRERNGLLRILFSEIYQANMPKEYRMKAERRTRGREHMYKETWEATRAQLAQHLPSDRFGVIAGYYANLMMLEKDVRQRQETRETDVIDVDATPELVEELHEWEQQVEQVVKEYVPDVTTDKITIGDLLKRAEARHKAQLEEGGERLRRDRAIMMRCLAYYLSIASSRAHVEVRNTPKDTPARRGATSKCATLCRACRGAGATGLPSC